MKKLGVLCIFGLVVLALGCQSAPPAATGPAAPEQIPVSRQGSIREVISSAEVMVEAFGLYYGVGNNDRARQNDVEANGNNGALLDARRTAIYTLLYGGTDPILANDSERTNFERNRDFFYSPENLQRYITFEDSTFQTRVRVEGGLALRVSKNFRVNREILLNDLVNRNVITARQDIMAQVGNPIIMVLPSVPVGQSPLDPLANDPQARQAATVIQSYLTARGYDVIVPEQTVELADLVSTQSMVAGRSIDFAYELALNIGSDVYITFSGSVEDGSFNTQRYVINLSAFETTTARLLGSETGFSQGRQGEILVSIEEAVNAAIDNTLSRITNYWRQDLQRGTQYKVIVSIEPGFADFELEDIQIGFMNAVDAVARSARELVVTDGTLDYLIWVDPQRYGRPLQLYQALRDAFAREGTAGRLGQISLNRKLMQLKIDF